MSGFWWLLLLLAQAGGDGRAVKLTAAADLAGWVDSGAVTASLPSFEGGRLQDLFDGDEATFALCGEGPAVFDFTFKRPLALSQLGIRVGGAGVYRWRAETANAPLFDWRHVEAGEHDPLPFRPAVKTKRLKLHVERLTLGTEVVLREIEVYTSVEIARLELTACPEQPRVGVPFTPLPMAVDRRGGRLRLSDGVALKAYPQGMLKINGQGICTPLHPGKAQLSFTFAALTSPAAVLDVKPPGPAPAELEVVPYSTTAAVHFENRAIESRRFAIYARRDGEERAVIPACITRHDYATVYGLVPDTAYYFSVAGLDDRGHPVTTRTDEIRLRTSAAGTPGLFRCACIDMLALIYDDGYDDEARLNIIGGFERARAFIFRSSGTRLAVNITYTSLPGSAPAEAGPGMVRVEEDLARRRVDLTGYGAVHVVASNMKQNCSGHVFRGGAIGSQGATAEARWPSNDAPLVQSACWTLVHEFQHTLDRLAPDLLDGHFLDNYPLPAGEVFDAGDFYCGQAETFRRLEGYLDLHGPQVRVLEAVDADEDGMPDSDGRLPCDERRLGSDPTLKDTDADGLDDREEYCAGLYRGTDVRNTDTDDDEIPDGMDPFPLSRFTGLIPRGTPRRGELPGTRLSSGVYFATWSPPPQLEIHAAWDERFLYLAFVSDSPLEIEVHIDGSGHLGPFESDRAVQDGSDVYTADRSFKLAFGGLSLLLGGAPVAGAQVLSAEKETGRVLWTAIPSVLGPGTKRCHVRDDAAPSRGLTLEEGRVLGLKFVVRPPGSDSAWSTVFETHRFLDAVLYR